MGAGRGAREVAEPRIERVAERGDARRGRPAHHHRELGSRHRREAGHEARSSIGAQPRKAVAEVGARLHRWRRSRFGGRIV